MRVDQALGGSNTPVDSPAAFVMPAGMRMRYDRASPALGRCVTGYAIYISDSRQPLVDWFLPSPAMVTVLLDAGPVSAFIRHRSCSDIPRASLWGPTSHAPRTLTHGGISVGIGLTALGWARLTAARADRHVNSVVALGGVIGSAVADELVRGLDALGSDADLAPTLDRLLPPLFRHPAPDEALVEALEALILTDGLIGVTDAAERLGVGARDLRHVACRHFGMPTKTLLSRARFIRSCARWMMAGEPRSYAGIDSSYFDASHFLRDAQTYLNTTPRRFAAGPTAFLRASLFARSAVIGAPAHTLHSSVRQFA